MDDAMQELRAILDSKGIKWRKWTKGNVKTVFDIENDQLKYLSPNVGDTCFIEMSVSSRSRKGPVYLKGYVKSVEAGLRAVLGEETCEDLADNDGYGLEFKCSECGCSLSLLDHGLEEPSLWDSEGFAVVPKYCPLCGRKVEHGSQD